MIVTHMWNLIFKKDTNELIYKIEMDLQILKTNLMVTKRETLWGGGINWKLGVTTIYKTDNQQGPTV